jgi:hypothetical protein
MNIGDLATHLDSADSLKPFLKKEGIEMLDIEIPDTSGVHACNYTFDSHLVDEEELPEELHDKIGNGT